MFKVIILKTDGVSSEPNEGNPQWANVLASLYLNGQGPSICSSLSASCHFQLYKVLQRTAFLPAHPAVTDPSTYYGQRLLGPSTFHLFLQQVNRWSHWGIWKLEREVYSWTGFLHTGSFPWPSFFQDTLRRKIVWRWPLLLGVGKTWINSAYKRECIPFLHLLLCHGGKKWRTEGWGWNCPVTQAGGEILSWPLGMPHGTVWMAGPTLCGHRSWGVQLLITHGKMIKLYFSFFSWCFHLE